MAKEEKSGNETNKKIVSLDIGSSKIGVFIGEILENGKVRILGFGNPVMKKGDDNELEATVNALKKAVVDFRAASMSKKFTSESRAAACVLLSVVREFLCATLKAL